MASFTCDILAESKLNGDEKSTCHHGLDQARLKGMFCQSKSTVCLIMLLVQPLAALSCHFKVCLSVTGLSVTGLAVTGLSVTGLSAAIAE